MPTQYRYEISPSNRAGCTNTKCKKEGAKIMKGELRFGVLVQINEQTSWKWKHWGCVTPQQIGNIIEQLGGLDGLDLDSDLDILDGYDELPDWAQGKVRYALQNGHIEDEDWKGDPELNRPGRKGINKRTPKKQDDQDGHDDEQEASPSKPKTKKARAMKGAMVDVEDGSPAPEKPVKSRKRKAVADESEAEEPAKTKVKKSAKKPKSEPADEDLASDEPLPKSKRKSVKTTSEQSKKTAVTDNTRNTKTKSTRSQKDKKGHVQEAETLENSSDVAKKTTKSKKPKKEELINNEVDAEESAPKTSRSRKSKGQRSRA